MMSTKNLVKLAQKWRRIAAASRKRISLPRSNSIKTSTATEKGQFVVYTTDERRFALPLTYLQSRVVIELLRMAEEEFGLGSDGRITLPCDSAFMEYAISIIQQISVATEMEEALILSLSASSLTHKMMSTKKLMNLARKWRRIAAASRKRISLPRSNSTKISPATDKGQFVVYTTDEGRFALPLAYLESQVVRELLRMAEEEFGLAGDGRITLPCDSAFMEYAISLMQQCVSTEMEEALILSLSELCSSNSASSSTDLCYAQNGEGLQQQAERESPSQEATEKGCDYQPKKQQFVVYTTDERRFALPLAYLQSRVVIELLRMVEEEFGFGGDGRITLPCDSAFMEYAISIIQQISVATEMEEALILSLSASSLTHVSHEQLPISCC
ncbi:hypothetical protein V2J09_000384 [Rumex salicifolius]